MYQLKTNQYHNFFETKCKTIINSHLVLSRIFFRCDKQYISSMNINELHLTLCLKITKTQRLPVLLADYVIESNDNREQLRFIGCNNDKCIVNIKE